MKHAKDKNYKKHAVKRLDLFVTEACNLACPYCFAATKPRKNPTEEETTEAVDWLMQSESPRVHLTLWGGEPLLRPGLLKHTVTYAREQAAAAGKKVTFSMPTNASLLDAETLAWLEEAGVQIFLSIDGDEAGQATRPLKAGGSSHELVSLGMRRALAQPPAVMPAVRMTVTPDNAARQGPSVRYFIDSGARELLIYAAMDQPWTAADLEAFTVGQREVADIFVDAISSCRDPHEVPAFKAWKPILRRLLDGVPPRRREGPLHHCGAGTDLVALTVEGKLAPCHRFVFYGRDRGEDVTVGDLETGVDPAKVERLKSLRVEEMRGVAKCVDCTLFDLCTYGCVAISYATSGELDQIPDAACQLMEKQVDVCREIHGRLVGDPRYAVYLGRSVASELNRTVGALGARALAHYRGRSNAGTKTREELGDDRLV